MLLRRVFLRVTRAAPFLSPTFLWRAWLAKTLLAKLVPRRPATRDPCPACARARCPRRRGA
jgi:hypothetical protein